MLHRCPHCDQACMSSLQKLFVSPASSISCKSCGKGVSIRWRYFIWLLLPVVLVLVGINLLELGPLSILLIGVPVAFAVSLIQLFFVPLSRSGRNRDTGANTAGDDN